MPVPVTLSGESNMSPAMSWRGASPRGLLTSTTYLDPGLELDAAEPRKVVREMSRAAKSSIRKPSVMCTLEGFKGVKLERRRAFETKEVKAGAAEKRVGRKLSVCAMDYYDVVGLYDHGAPDSNSRFGRKVHLVSMKSAGTCYSRTC